MSRSLAVLTTLALLAAPPAAAQSFAGTYTMTNAKGGAITLVLKQDASGRVTGSMSGNGSTFIAEGKVQGSEAIGTFKSGNEGVFFEASFAGAQLHLILLDPGPDGKPDYSKGQEIALDRVGGAGPTVAARGAPAGGGLSGASADPFIGSFNSDEIALTISKRGAKYAGSLEYQGRSYVLAASAASGKMSGTFTSDANVIPFEAQMNGNYLLMKAGSTTYMLVKGAPQQAAGAGMSGGMGGGAPQRSSANGSTAQDQQLIKLLMSYTWCTMSYTSTGTYTGGSGSSTSSSRTRFYGDGTLVTNSGSEVGNSGGNGSATGQTMSGDRMYWKVQQGTLFLSQDGVNFQPQQIKVTTNSAGWPIITGADGKEYNTC